MLHGDKLPEDISDEQKRSYEKRGIIGELDNDHPHVKAADQREKDLKESKEASPKENKSGGQSKKKTNGKK